MSIPKEPRQMMINMMYLVLTALLAMNVSAEILNAFHVVNQGINNSNTSVSAKNDKSMKLFKDQLDIQHDKAKPYYDKAVLAKQYTEDLNKTINEFMKDIVKGSGGWVDLQGKDHKDGDWTPQTGYLQDDKNLDVSTRLMIEDKGADKLQKSIEDTRNKLLALIDPNDKKQYESQLPLRIDKPEKNAEGEIKTWEEANFHMVPTIASLTLLNKFQNDAKNSESQVIDYLLGKINATDFKVDKMTAKVIAPSSYIMAGQEYKADIFVAAYNSSVSPVIEIGSLNSNAVKEGDEYKETKVDPVSGGRAIPVEGGMGKFSAGASGEGEQKYSGAVKITGPDGQPVYYPFEASYTTAKGSAVISSDNLNIIYAGIPNPFSVSVPGFDASKVTASASSGSFSGAKGKYTANMPATMIGQKIKINVVVKSDDKTLPLGSQEFVVKRIPDPVAIVAGKTEGKIRTGELKATPGVIAQLKDFYFQGVTFSVTSYDFIYIGKRQDPYIKSNSGLAWNPEVKSKIDGSKPGDQIIIRNIKAKGPDGSIRSLSPISLEIN